MGRKNSDLGKKESEITELIKSSKNLTISLCQEKKNVNHTLLGLSFDNDKDPRYAINYGKVTVLESNDPQSSSNRDKVRVHDFDPEQAKFKSMIATFDIRNRSQKKRIENLFQLLLEINTEQYGFIDPWDYALVAQRIITGFTVEMNKSKINWEKITSGIKKNKILKEIASDIKNSELGQNISIGIQSIKLLNQIKKDYDKGKENAASSKATAGTTENTVVPTSSNSGNIAMTPAVQQRVATGVVLIGIAILIHGFAAFMVGFVVICLIAKMQEDRRQQSN